MLRSAWRGTLRLQRFLMDEMLKPYRWGNEKLIKGSLINSEGVMRSGKPSLPSYRIIFLSSPEKSFPGLTLAIMGVGVGGTAKSLCL